MTVSVLDNDMYKITMAQLILHNFPNTYVEYDLQIRSNVDLRPIMLDVKRCIMELISLRLSLEEKMFLKSIRYISEDFIEWFANFRYNPEKHVKIWNDETNMRITISGNWLNTIFYEVPILAIISECWNLYNHEEPLAECTERLMNKIEFLKRECPDLLFSEFGTRRRYSYFIQDHIVEILARELPKNLFGTSNMYLAMKYGLTVVGTMAHELFMNSLSLFPLPTCQKDMLYLWAREFQGDLGYALSDTLGVDYFLKDFTLDLAKLYSGTRQDSGDPYVYGEKIIAHYEKLGIDPRTKYIIFSDNLNFEKAISLWRAFHNRIITSFGIGTYLSNDTGIKPLSIVIKSQLCNGIPIVKLSDTPEKAMGRDVNFLEFMKTFVGGV